jgi:CRP/FNR family transcriptional regulator, LitR-dependent transcriptional activator
LVRITGVTPDGRTLTVRHVRPGVSFGEDALTDGERSESAEALTQVSIDAIDPERIEAANLIHLARSSSDQIGRSTDYPPWLSEHRVARPRPPRGNRPAHHSDVNHEGSER